MLTGALGAPLRSQGPAGPEPAMPAPEAPALPACSAPLPPPVALPAAPPPVSKLPPAVADPPAPPRSLSAEPAVPSCSPPSAPAGAESGEQPGANTATDAAQMKKSRPCRCDVCIIEQWTATRQRSQNSCSAGSRSEMGKSFCDRRAERAPLAAKVRIRGRGCHSPSGDADCSAWRLVGRRPAGLACRSMRWTAISTLPQPVTLLASACNDARRPRGCRPE